MDVGNIRAGLSTFNAVLVGSVTASLWTPLYDEPLSLKVWGFIVLGSVLRSLNIELHSLDSIFQRKKMAQMAIEVIV